MASLPAFVRYQGSSFREYLTKLYVVNGDEAGEEVSRRMIWEIVDHATEAHGPTVAQDMLRGALDGLQIDLPPPISSGSEQGADPFEQTIQRTAATLQAQTQAFAAMGDSFGVLASAVHGLRKATAEKPTRAQVAWRIFDRLMWWPLWLCAGVVLAELLK